MFSEKQYTLSYIYDCLFVDSVLAEMSVLNFHGCRTISISRNCNIEMTIYKYLTIRLLILFEAIINTIKEAITLFV